jgi:hypothetical protein
MLKFINKQKLNNTVKHNLSLIKTPSLKFYFNFFSTVYWPNSLSYENLQHNFLEHKVLYKRCLQFWESHKSEVLLRFSSRNTSLIVHSIRLPSIIYKKHLYNREKIRSWNNDNLSTILFGFSVGRCGFKQNETKSFIAIDTLIRAGLWFLVRYRKKIAPFKLRFMGSHSRFRKYLYRFKPAFKKHFKFSINSIDDETPRPHNGCRLSHLPRKRFRRHSYSYSKIAKYIKTYKY